MSGILRYCSPRFKKKIMQGDLPEWFVKHPRMSYIRQRILSAPDWVDRKALVEIEKKAKELTKLTGVDYVVDHIVPLSNAWVCGLTVPWNLEVITREQNAYKSNRWCQWHGDLFTEPEQFRLFG